MVINKMSYPVDTGGGACVVDMGLACHIGRHNLQVVRLIAPPAIMPVIGQGIDKVPVILPGRHSLLQAQTGTIYITLISSPLCVFTKLHFDGN